MYRGNQRNHDGGKLAEGVIKKEKKKKGSQSFHDRAFNDMLITS